MKKIITSLLLLVLLIGMLTVGAYAEETMPVMTVDGTEYTDFESGWNAAIAATVNNDNTVEVVFYDDWTAAEGSFGEGKGFRKGAIYVPEDTKDLAVDLNGHTIDRGLFEWNDFSADPVVDKGRESGEVIQIDEGSKNITIKDGTIKGANNKDYGGIYIDKAENILFENIDFISNKSEQGGALYNNEGKVSFERCEFKLNYAIYGGAVYSDYDKVDIIQCVFTENRARQAGGAIYNYDATFNVIGCEFKKNEAKKVEDYGKFGNGGAIYINGGNTELILCKFNNNSVYYYGGAIYHDSGGLKAEYCKFDNNEAYGGEHSSGGACSLENDATFIGCDFTNNEAGYNGAIDVNDTVSFTDCIFKGNKSKEAKGQNASVMTAAESAEITMKNCTVTDNIGDCAIHIYATFLDAGEIWFDGKNIIQNNKNSDGKEINVVCTSGDPFGAYIVLKKGFSKDSRVGLAMYDEDMRGEVCVEDIPDDWTIIDLANCFSVDECFFIKDYDPNDDEYYLEKDGSSLKFHKGNPQNSIHSKADALIPVHKITVENGSVISGKGKEGETVTIKASNADSNMGFVRWEGEGVDFADPESIETTFVMPKEDVSVKAVFGIIPEMPIASHSSGRYDDKFILELTSPEGYDIEYSIGDSDYFSFKYTNAIDLNTIIAMHSVCDDGLMRPVYEISAVCVSDEGLLSDKLQLRFEIGEGYDFTIPVIKDTEETGSGIISSSSIADTVELTEEDQTDEQDQTEESVQTEEEVLTDTDQENESKLASRAASIFSGGSVMTILLLSALAIAAALIGIAVFGRRRNK